MPDEKTTVVNTGGNGLGLALFGIALIAALVVLFLLFGQGLMKGDAAPIKADVKIDAPAKP